MKLIKINGFLSNLREIMLENGKILNLNDLIEESMQIPFGSSIEVSIAFDENDFLSGKNGVVWASYDQRQVDIIKNALNAQNISTEIMMKNLGSRKIFLLLINYQNDLNETIDFIWKHKNGLCLKPDWFYPDGQINKSFEQWLSGR